MERIRFIYHPNLYSNDILIHKEGVCECCGKKVTEYIEQPYAAGDIDCICLACVHDGSAAKKSDAEFIQDAEEVSDPAKRDELFHRTPGYTSWQGEYWLACCDDYCEYLQTAGIKEPDELGITEEVLKDYLEQDIAYDEETVRKYLVRDGSLCGYLFRCLHCGKYRLYIDAD